MQDNVMFATESIRSSVASLKKKLSNLRIAVEQFDSDLEKIDTKFDKLLTQTEIYKAKLEREMGRQTRKLELELAKLRKQLEENQKEQGVVSASNSLDLQIASTIGIFECILRNMCGHAEDFRLMSYAFLFPAVYERVLKAEEPAYLIDTIPDSASIVVQRGKEYISYIRSICETHVTDERAWDQYISEVTDWWRNDALPLLYGSRDEEWDEDIPLTLTEMLVWKQEPAERPIHFSAVFDAFELYKNNKDAIYDSSGIRELDLKMFQFDAENQG